jgi:ribosomal protein S18 acetylase RimI-like enzyme
MIGRRVRIQAAQPGDAEGIARVCAAGWRETYAGLKAPAVIEAVIAEYYTPERIRGEIDPAEGWDGWIVAVEDGAVVGAGAGGMTAPGVGEVFVLYLDPGRRGEGIGTLLLAAITEQQRGHGAREQWVSVEPDNEKGLPFYRARGFEVHGTRPEWGTAPEDGRVSLRLRRRLEDARDDAPSR